MSLIKVENLAFKYDRYILRNVEFAVERGSFVSLLGINGAGKSTLLKNLDRTLKPSFGTVYLNGKNLARLRRREAAQMMACVGQYNEPIKSTVFDMILVGRVPYVKREVSKEDYRKVEEILGKLALEEYAMRDASTLSGGEFQKVVLARALAQEPEIILLDEPTSNLDIKNQLDVMRLLKEYCREKGIAAIVSIHDINLALQFSDKFLMLKEGCVFAYGDDSVVTREAIKEVYRLDVAVQTYGNRKVIILN
ncbi:ABC transporter ATP-binding protein [Pyramidobacter piscolens]|uniref:ABC transporter ATP-binding protein n=1 Tax=Pyramidobacter piscolens TaxID=638849 RepID=UPI0024913305|nr:ABC transporter ATP-binding protein [Pyramidobacter piscolens]